MAAMGFPGKPPSPLKRLPPVERSLLRWGFPKNRTKSSGASSALQGGRDGI